MNRKGFIGGSDLYAIENGSWHDLWLVKTGRKEPDDLSNVFRVNLGSETELFNMRWFEIQTGNVVEAVQKEVGMNYEGIPLKGTLDGILQNGDIIECKHTSNFNKMSDILEKYMGQIQFYMWISNRYQTHMSVIFGNEWDTCIVKRDNEIMERYRSLMKRFWEYVRTDKEPPNDIISEKIDWSKIEVNGLVARDATDNNHFVDAAHTFISTQDKAKEHEQAKKDLRSMINDNEREVFCDLSRDGRVSVKRDKRGACRVSINKKEAANG